MNRVLNVVIKSLFVCTAAFWRELLGDAADVLRLAAAAAADVAYA